MQFVRVLLIMTVLFALLLPGYILRKTRLVSKASVCSMANILLYVCMPFLTLKAFVINPLAPSLRIVANMGWVFLFATVGQIFVFFIAKLVFIKAKDKKKAGMYVFAAVFSNAGFVGLPFIDLLTKGNSYALIYGTIFVVSYNILVWTLGVYIITGNKRDISIKKALLNPATLSLAVALPMFFIPQINIFNMDALRPIDEIVKYLGNMTAPLSMLIVGIRMADIPLKEIFASRALYGTAAVKLIVAPLLMFALLLPFRALGLFGNPSTDEFVYRVPVLLMAIAPGAMMIALSERYEGDTMTAVKAFVGVTVISIVTLPLMVMLLW